MNYKPPKHNNNNNNNNNVVNVNANANINMTKRSQSSNSSYMDSPHSPLRFHSPLNSAFSDPSESPPYSSPDNNSHNNDRAIVTVPRFPPLPPPAAEKLPPATLNRSVKEDGVTGVTMFRPSAGGDGGGGGGREERGRTVAEVIGRDRREDRVMVSGLSFRISELVLCLVSFSVMAADKTQGWSGDSFDRYKEYRYCLSMNIIGFVYAAFQAYDLSYFIVSGKHVIGHHMRRHFDFFMDQMIAYLLMSASSSAATRVDDWQSNWGRDDFTIMASASIAMSFMAFVAFAFSSLISGYNLFNRDAML